VFLLCATASGYVDGRLDVHCTLLTGETLVRPVLVPVPVSVPVVATHSLECSKASSVNMIRGSCCRKGGGKSVEWGRGLEVNACVRACADAVGQNPWAKRFRHTFQMSYSTVQGSLAFGSNLSAMGYLDATEDVGIDVDGLHELGRKRTGDAQNAP